jgi:hypothetical protein
MSSLLVLFAVFIAAIFSAINWFGIVYLASRLSRIEKQLKMEE